VRLKPGNRMLVAGTLVALSALAVVVVLAAGDHPGSAPSPTISPESASGAWNIFVIDLKRREPVQLTRNEEEEFTLDPAWGPGSKIAFSQADCEGCPSHLLLIDPLSRGTSRVRSEFGGYIDPAWAPGGHELAVARSGSGLNLIDVRTGMTRRLTRGSTDDRPTWSPDGRRIAFERQVSPTNWDIYLVPSAGGTPRPLMRTPAQETSAAWSPNGRWIAFARQGRNGNWTIHVVRPDGTRDRAVTGRRRSSQQPAWSPDGSRIAYLDQSGDEATVQVMSARGGRPVRLSSSSLQANRPTWSPGGTQIAFAAKR
jgi:Tol biopolymer transport system component